jgi:Outer membrane protein and related peptidoglycan-associated (lipo)proteins
VALLKAHPNLKVRVAGHTDSVVGKSYNLDLSRRRAHSVTAYLQSKGIASGRLQSVGYGMERPVATNDTPSGRAKNRRTECEIVGI